MLLYVGFLKEMKRGKTQCVRGKTVTQSMGLTDEFMCSNKLIHGPCADITLVRRINSGFIL